MLRDRRTKFQVKVVIVSPGTTISFLIENSVNTKVVVSSSGSIKVMGIQASKELAEELSRAAVQADRSETLRLDCLLFRKQEVSGMS